MKDPLTAMTPSRRLFSAGLTALLISTATAFAGDPSGTWKTRIEGPDGRALESTLTLVWADGRLTGTVSNRAGSAEIADATFENEKVVFTVHRELRRGLFRKRKFATTYTGLLDGDVLRGTIQTTGRDQKPVSIPWEAHRESTAAP